MESWWLQCSTRIDGVCEISLHKPSYVSPLTQENKSVDGPVRTSYAMAANMCDKTMILPHPRHDWIGKNVDIDIATFDFYQINQAK